MAVTHNPLGSGNSATDGTSWETASIAPAANRLVLATVVTFRDDAVGDALEPTLAGNGLTWVQVATRAYALADFDTLRITVFRAMGAAPSAGAVTISVGATHQGAAWSIVEFDGVDTGGTDGSAAVVQSATGEGSGTTPAATLAAFGSSNNATFGGAANTSDASTYTPGTGFTEIHETASAGAANLQTQWRDDNDTSVDSTQSGSTGWATIAVEIAAAAAAVVGGYYWPAGFFPANYWPDDYWPTATEEGAPEFPPAFFGRKNRRRRAVFER